jgi:hypothetical protein
MITVVVLAWGLAVVVGVVIGGQKDRITEALFLSLLLSWVGVIIVACLSNRKDACPTCGIAGGGHIQNCPRRTAVLAMGQMSCPSCQRSITGGSRFCPFCGWSTNPGTT